SSDLNPMGYNPNNISFQFPGLNAAERNLIAQYGKIFYFEVDIFEQATGAFIGKFFLQVHNESVDGSSPIPYWIPAGGIQANVPGGAGLRDVLYYHNQTAGVPTDTKWPMPYPTMPGAPGYFCNSREVVIKQAHLDKYTFFYNGNPWEIHIGMAIGSHLWLTSGPFLVVQPQ